MSDIAQELQEHLEKARATAAEVCQIAENLGRLGDLSIQAQGWWTREKQYQQQAAATQAEQQARENLIQGAIDKAKAAMTQQEWDLLRAWVRNR